MAYTTILYDVQDGIATITLNRPESYNALNTPMYGELQDALKQIGRDESVRAVILTGGGQGLQQRRRPDLIRYVGGQDRGGRFSAGGPESDRDVHAKS